MAQSFALPKWGLTMEEGTIAEWVAQPGDRVQEGAVLARVETDKIEVEFVAPVSGIVAAHLAERDATVPVGEPIVVIASDEQDLSAYRSGGAG